MRKRNLYPAFASVIIALLLSGCEPSGNDAINFIEKAVRAQMNDPDSARFTDVAFFPEGSVGGESLSGAVCGYVNAKNSYGAYAGKQRFYSRITVTNGGGSARYQPPALEDTSNSVSRGGFDKLFDEACKAKP